jgi:hypothetical protein
LWLAREGSVKKCHPFTALGGCPADISTTGKPDVFAAMVQGGFARPFPADGAKAGAVDRCVPARLRKETASASAQKL